MDELIRTMPLEQCSDEISSDDESELATTFGGQVLRSAIESGFFSDDQPLAAFVDLKGVRDTIDALKRAFPDHFEHTFAAKANTMSAALRLVRQCGMGCETASQGELQQAWKAGFQPQHIVYDEPTKSRSILRTLLQRGIGLNIDNFQEYARLQTMEPEGYPESRIGFRINPQVGQGSIQAMSTASKTSKFGIPIQDAGVRDQLIGCYLESPWLTTMHTHIGSQGCELTLMVAGIRQTVDLAEEINSKLGRQQINTIDIGGGLPVNFDGDEVKPTFEDYADILREKVPELFSGKYRVKTEFGRTIFAKNGFIAARVEYTKVSGGRHIALTHAGVQVAARTVFMPDHWKIRLSVRDSEGNARRGNLVSQDIAGPCCFAGDLIGVDRMLPLIQPGDYVMLHDTGAYYFSNPFYYNSLQSIAVYGCEISDQNEVEFDTWRRQQSMDDMLEMLG